MGFCISLGEDVKPRELHQLVGNFKEVSRAPRFVNWKKPLQFSVETYLVVWKKYNRGRETPLVWPGKGMVSVGICTNKHLGFCDQKRPLKPIR